MAARARATSGMLCLHDMFEYLQRGRSANAVCWCYLLSSLWMYTQTMRNAMPDSYDKRDEDRMVHLERCLTLMRERIEDLGEIQVHTQLSCH
jgi:hypothetical protein